MALASSTASIVGRYALHGVLATGGMATVHVGRLMGQAGFSRTVAIKRLHPQFAQDPEFVAMFLDEARLAARIRHPNAIAVTDVVASDGEVLLVMDYVQGETLARLVRSVRDSGERIPSRLVAAIMCDALDGLHAAHEALDEHGTPLGIVHRDVSPQNIMVGIDGIARVLDFGIAKAAGRSQVTRDGQLKGKLAYMSPEQLRGQVTRGADIYSAGIVLWEALTSQRLYAGDNEGHTVAMILKGRVPRPSELGAPAVYDEVVLKALSRKPSDRFATAREMSMALAKVETRADPHEVGAWVQGAAKQWLDARAEVVSAVETLPPVDTDKDLPRAPPSAPPPDPSATKADLSTDAMRSLLPPIHRRVVPYVVVGSAIVAFGLAGTMAWRHAPTPSVEASQVTIAPRGAGTASTVVGEVTTPGLTPSTPSVAAAFGVDAATTAVPEATNGRPASSSSVAPHGPAPRPRALPAGAAPRTASPESPRPTPLPDHL